MIVVFKIYLIITYKLSVTRQGIQKKNNFLEYFLTIKYFYNQIKVL
jgi:hypothetical protein